MKYTIGPEHLSFIIVDECNMTQSPDSLQQQGLKM